MHIDHTTQSTFIKLSKNAADITGQRFGRWIAIGPVERRKKQVMWLCRCDCGNEGIIQVGNLVSGKSKSCGCYMVEQSRTHGKHKSKEYVAWQSMRRRCMDSSNERYESYGGRGITVCEEWRNDFAAFYNHIGPAPYKDASVGRQNNDGNYEPGNVAWESRTQQQRNMRSNHLITYNGKTQCLSAWAEELGVTRSALESRIRKGWDIDRAFTQPVKKRQ